jgi:hypothetical protein
VPIDIFGQTSVFLAVASFMTQASIRLPVTSFPLARMSGHFMVGVPSGNEITPCAADKSAVARRCASAGVGQMVARLEGEAVLGALAARVTSIEIEGDAVHRDSTGLRALSSLPVRVVAK